MNKEALIEWGFRLLAAGIIFQTLFYKFSAHPESVLLFTQLGAEPAGRITLGFIELIVVLFLVVPETVKYGIVLGLGIMGGALLSHLLVLGIEFNDDGGRLFSLAIITTLALLVLAYRHQDEIRRLLPGKTR